MSLTAAIVDVAQGRQGRGGGVVARLLRRLRARDRAGHLREHEDPAQRELAEGRARGQELAQLLDRFQADVVGHAGERLALVEALALAVELAMVVGGEAGIGLELAGEEPAGQRHAGQDPDLALAARRRRTGPPA